VFGFNSQGDSAKFLPAILQRVLSASVTVDKQLVSSIGKGVLVFAAVAPGDTEKDADALAAKVLKMRLWDDDAGERVGTYFAYRCLVAEKSNRLVVETKCSRHQWRGPLWCVVKVNSSLEQPGSYFQ